MTRRIPSILGEANAGRLVSRIVESKVIPKPISLGPSETLKVLLTTTEGKKAKRPHQAFLLVEDTKADLDTSFAFSIKESGKGKLELVCAAS